MISSSLVSDWAFVDERLAMITRKRDGTVPLTRDHLLKTGVFGNIFPEDDPDTNTAERLSRRLPALGDKIEFDVFFRYSGSHVDSARAMTATGSSGTWTQTLRKRSEGGEAIIRTDAYHNNWGNGTVAG